MKVLYYTWDEIINQDVIDSLQEICESVDVLQFEIKDKLNDLAFTTKLSEMLDKKEYDCIFTMNFIPIVSKIAYAYNIKYISWLFDSNLFDLYTDAIKNETNFVFTYDFLDYQMLLSWGVAHCFYLPLAANTTRLDKLIGSAKKYKYDVSFLGSLYNDSRNFLDQIPTLPKYYSGYFDAIIESQLKLYGIDLASELITDEFYDRISSYVTFNLDQEMFITPRDLICYFIQRKETVVERERLLGLISEKFDLTLFAPASSDKLKKVNFKGYADYYNEMPLIFNQSKINLNITLRNIKTATPLRCVDIMGAGGFLLSNYQQELVEQFENGAEMVVYESPDDAMEKIEYFLSHEKEREEIALNGKRKIETEYTYECAFRKIFESCVL